MRVRLAYGRAGLGVELPDRNVVRVLRYRRSEPLEDPMRAAREAIEHPTPAPGSSPVPLADLGRGRRSACVVVCDVTRPVPNRVLLPPILAALEQGGLPRDRTLILVATGLHRPNRPDELVEMLGRSIVEDYRVENHRAQELAEHTYLGDSPRGVPIWIDSRYLAADLKIATGLIEPHFMAGFSGGRKLICPGLAASPTIRAWHSPRFLEHTDARSGVLAGNPVHEENTWIARRAGCDFIASAVIDERRRVLAVVAGDMEAAHAEGVRFVRPLVTDTLGEPVDIVVTSSAGYPLDATFYQSIKGMVGAAEIVKPGGTIIIAAGMSEGIGGPEFRRTLDESASLEAFMKRILATEEVVVDQWQLEEMAKARRKARLVAVTDGLPPETLSRLFVESALTVEAAVADALARHGPNATIAVIPDGPYVVASLRPPLPHGEG